jgi:dolichol-phosphate mannosyltransferase
LIKIIFCALNEAQNLNKLVTDLVHEIQNLQHNVEIIACLDGTVDESVKIINSFQKLYPIKILPLKDKKGLGLAYKRLFLEVLKNSSDDDLVISLDADNTHNPGQIPRIVQYFKKKSLDLLVVSRFCNNSIVADFPMHRRLISKAVSILLQNLFAVKKISGQKLQDFTSGYRVYKVKKLRELFLLQKNNFITEPEFTYTCELLIKLSHLNSNIDEVPISYDYGKKLGASKMHLFRNFWRLFILLAKLC